MNQASDHACLRLEHGSSAFGGEVGMKTAQQRFRLDAGFVGPTEEVF